MGEYRTVNGLKTYFEEQGEGEPLVLLHGGGVGADSWGPLMPALAEHYRVFAPERRGHARTPDVEGPMTWDAMADDTVAFLESLGTGPVNLIGWSDGATVGVHVALRRPDLVRKLVLIGTTVTRDGETAASQALSEDSGREELEGFLRGEYEPLSPDGPEHFPIVFDKLMRLWRENPGVGLAALTGLRTPTLVMQGDDDGVYVEHSAAMVRALPDAQLAVVPGASHALPLEKPALVTTLLLDFLADEQAPKFMPLGALTAR
jgi:pimeloyl-ACP methyl ester carboxylesterase